MERRTLLIWKILFALAFTALLLGSNAFDWDLDFSFFEAERRSWLLDGRLPLWSYQLCAGTTRLGDPVAFGLSPIFAFVLALGPLWGAKAMVLFCFGAGYRFLGSILDSCGLKGSRDADSANVGLRLIFLFGNYFLWHLNNGHITFALLPLALGPIACAFKAWSGECRGRDYLVSALVTFTVFSAGFYHALVFFLVPLAIAGAIALGAAFPRLSWDRARRFRVLKACGAAGAGLALASYKWIGVLRYQGLFPRELKANASGVADALALPDLFSYLLVPTYRYRLLGFLPNDDLRWGMWEYSSFTLIAWAALWLVGLRFWMKPGAVRMGQAEKIAFGVAGAAVVLFCLGDFGPGSPHAIVNALFYHHSVRVSARYQIALIFVLLLVVARWLTLSPAALKVFARVFLPAGLALTLVNFWTFHRQVDFGRLWAVAAIPAEGAARMKRIVIPAQAKFDSYMYEHVRRGEIVLTCYQPLRRERTLTQVDRLGDGSVRLLRGALGGLSPKCQDSAFLTQNSWGLDRGACPGKVCFNIDSLNIHEPSELTKDPAIGAYCLN